jgi:hypothetical protein
MCIEFYPSRCDGCYRIAIMLVMTFIFCLTKKNGNWMAFFIKKIDL